MASRKKSSASETAVASAADAGQQFLGQWNRLISSTNWEKGRIICEWREALMADGAAVSDYSDETWAQLVGGVTSQHVGRLRRVSQRFGEGRDQYAGLYWSHFQAALDWDDAEMWLEGAIHSEWSVSQMRGKRWETLGTPGDASAEDDVAVANRFAAEGIVIDDPANRAEQSAPRGGELTLDEDDARKDEARAADAPSASRSVTQGDEDAPFDDGTTAEAGPAEKKASRTRLSVEVDELPDDLAEAFEQFKLAIIAHRREGWSETTPDAVVECLESLRQLALAPVD